MMGQPTKWGLRGAIRRLLGFMGLFAGLVPMLVQAQTSIDQGKSPAEMFSLDCATCHKNARGLAKGRSTSDLSSFLAEHYTSGKDQAASLAAYVMGAGGGEAAPVTQGRGAKPTPPPDHARTEEPKREPGKFGESTPTTAKLQPPASEEQKRPGDVPSIMQERARKPAAGGRPEPTTASRGQRQDTEGKPQEPPREVPSEPSHEAAEPSAAPAAAAPESSPAPTASVPGSADSGEGAPVPRDNIPD
jgi:hypothetical protein